MIVMKRMSVWLALAGVGFAAWVLMGANKKDPMPLPSQSHHVRHTNSRSGIRHH